MTSKAPTANGEVLWPVISVNGDRQGRHDKGLIKIKSKASKSYGRRVNFFARNALSLAGCVALVNYALHTRITKQASRKLRDEDYTPKELSATPKTLEPTKTVQEDRKRAENVSLDRSSFIMDLLPWEEASISSFSMCANPNGTSPSCCLGSFSRGGRVNPRIRHHCGGKEEAYNTIREDALDLLQKTDHLILASERETCDVCQILNIALSHNLTIGFTGDSMQAQIFDGLRCELRRQGYSFQDKYKVGTGIETGIRDVQTLSIPIARSKDKSADVEILNITFYHQFIPNISDMEYISKASDILVFNFGLLWDAGARSDYKRAMDELFVTFKKHNFALLAHRETSAQHFNAEGGDHGNESRNASSQQCVPMQWGPMSGWREPIVQDCARNNGFNVIFADKRMRPSEITNAEHNADHIDETMDGDEFVVLPYFNFTARNNELHPTHNIMDCTHYCSTPFLWMPLWRSLRLALERKFPYTRKESFGKLSKLMN